MAQGNVVFTTSHTTLDHHCTLLYDSGANVSVVRDVGMLNANTCVKAQPEQQDNNVGGIDSATMGLVKSGQGHLQGGLAGITAWHCPQSAANVLAQCDAAVHFDIYTDPRGKYVELTRRDNGGVVRFVENDEKLYVFQEGASHKAKCFVGSKIQLLGLSKPEIDKAMQVELLHKGFSYCGRSALLKMVQRNTIRGCNLVTADVNTYFDRLHDLTCALGKRMPQ